MPLPLKALRPPLSLPSRATLAYNHPKTIPHDEHGHLIGLPVSQHIQKSESLMRAWLALYHTGQHGLHSELKPDKRRQGTITQYLVCRTQKPRTRPKLPTRYQNLVTSIVSSAAFRAPSVRPFDLHILVEFA